MRNTSINWVQMSDLAIINQIGNYIKHVRMQQNMTQAQLAKIAGLNRWTVSKIEKGESITLASLIQILRALDNLFVLNEFEVSDVISPLEYAKLKKKQKLRVRNNIGEKPSKTELGW